MKKLKTEGLFTVGVLIVIAGVIISFCMLIKFNMDENKYKENKILRLSQIEKEIPKMDENIETAIKAYQKGSKTSTAAMQDAARLSSEKEKLENEAKDLKNNVGHTPLKNKLIITAVIFVLSTGIGLSLIIKAKKFEIFPDENIEKISAQEVKKLKHK